MTPRPPSAAVRLAALIGVVVLLVSCTPSVRPVGGGDPSASASPAAGFAFRGKGSAFEALDRLCPKPVRDEDSPLPTSGSRGGRTTGSVNELQRQVADVRGLEFLDGVEVDSVSAAEMADRVRADVRDALRGSPVDRRSRAWETIGVVPAGTDLRTVYEELLAGQVIGYYDPATEELVFTGSDDPSALERFTLAHELTHALEDQHFDLSRLDELTNRCREEAYAAGLAAVEGSAMRTSLDVVAEHFTTEERMEIFGEGLGADPGIPEGTPPFVVGELLFPYLDGMAFIMGVSGDDGNAAVDDVLTHLPVSTEQVLHPELLGVDVPRRADIPDLGSRVGEGWHDLDVMEIGEDFLTRMLELELPADRAREAAAGWDGGVYRAWSSGDRTAVAMSTLWDSDREAAAFAAALRAWTGDRPAAVSQTGDRVDVLFASDGVTLSAFLAVADGSRMEAEPAAGGA